MEIFPLRVLGYVVYYLLYVLSSEQRPSYSAIVSGVIQIVNVLFVVPMYVAGVAQDNSKVHKAADSSHIGSQRSPAAVETESHLFNSFLSKVLSM